MPLVTIDKAQTFLFVPADRPDRFAKAAASGADIVVLDLEDAVAPPAKQEARMHACAWLAAGNTAMVRINGADTAWHSDDLGMVVDCAAPVMLPKAEGRAALERIAATTQRMPIVPLIETPAGVLAATEISLAPQVARLAFGSIDLAAHLGVDPDDREPLLFARSTLVTASAAAGLPPPIDGVTAAFADMNQASADATYAKRLGMSAKLCIHPRQIAAVRSALKPTPEEIEWAQRTMAAARDTDSATAVDGALVDPPVIRRALQILAAAGLPVP